MIKLNELAQYTGSEHFYLYNGNLVVTDGIRYLMDNGCAWLIDIIVSVRGLPAIQAEDFEAWTLKVDLETHTAKVIATDGDKGDGAVTLYRQEIEYTDCPVKELKLFVSREGHRKTIMLNSEY